MTAEELMAILEADPKWVAERARLDAEHAQKDAELSRAEAPVVADLRSAGYAIESVWDLVNTSAPYPKALPVLLAHLPRSYPAAIREGIARALAVPEAKFGWEVLVRLYRDEQDARAKGGLAVAIAEAADAVHLDEVIALLRDARHGPSRILLLSALERSNNPRAWATLMDLGTDPELEQEIQVILRKRQRKRSKRRHPRSSG